MTAVRKSPSLERAAEAQFMLRPVIESNLKSQIITDEARQRLGRPWKNYHEMWIGTFADKFHDMATVVRMGAAVEEELRAFYTRKRGHKTLVELSSDPDYKRRGRGAFQRIMPWQTKERSAKDILSLVGYDLFSNPEIGAAQRIMLHRHLYAHNLGAVDDDYLDKWKQLTGEDIRPLVKPYPDEDMYWFRPLGEIDGAITDLRDFVRHLV